MLKATASLCSNHVTIHDIANYVVSSIPLILDLETRLDLGVCDIFIDVLSDIRRHAESLAQLSEFHVQTNKELTELYKKVIWCLDNLNGDPGFSPPQSVLHRVPVLHGCHIWLNQAFYRLANSTPPCQAACIIGSPGSGKTTRACALAEKLTDCSLYYDMAGGSKIGHNTVADVMRYVVTLNGRDSQTIFLDMEHLRQVYLEALAVNTVTLVVDNVDASAADLSLLVPTNSIAATPAGSYVIFVLNSDASQDQSITYVAGAENFAISDPDAATALNIVKHNVLQLMHESSENMPALRLAQQLAERCRHSSLMLQATSRALSRAVAHDGSRRTVQAHLQHMFFPTLSSDEDAPQRGDVLHGESTPYLGSILATLPAKCVLLLRLLSLFPAAVTLATISAVSEFPIVECMAYLMDLKSLALLDFVKIPRVAGPQTRFCDWHFRVCLPPTVRAFLAEQDPSPTAARDDTTALEDPDAVDGPSTDGTDGEAPDAGDQDADGARRRGREPPGELLLESLFPAMCRHFVQLLRWMAGEVQYGRMWNSGYVAFYEELPNVRVVLDVCWARGAAAAGDLLCHVLFLSGLDSGSDRAPGGPCGDAGRPGAQFVANWAALASLALEEERARGRRMKSRSRSCSVGSAKGSSRSDSPGAQIPPGDLPDDLHHRLGPCALGSLKDRDALESLADDLVAAVSAESPSISLTGSPPASPTTGGPFGGFVTRSAATRLREASSASSEGSPVDPDDVEDLQYTNSGSDVPSDGALLYCPEDSSGAGSCGSDTPSAASSLRCSESSFSPAPQPEAPIMRLFKELRSPAKRSADAPPSASPLSLSSGGASALAPSPPHVLRLGDARYPVPRWAPQDPAAPRAEYYGWLLTTADAMWMGSTRLLHFAQTRRWGGALARSTSSGTFCVARARHYPASSTHPENTRVPAIALTTAMLRASPRPVLAQLAHLMARKGRACVVRAARLRRESARDPPFGAAPGGADGFDKAREERQLGQCLVQLCRSLIALSHFRRASKGAKKLQQLLQEAKHHNSVQLAALMYDTAGVYLELGDPVEACGVLSRSASVLRGLSPPLVAPLARVHERYGRACAGAGRYQDAIAGYARAAAQLTGAEGLPGTEQDVKEALEGTPHALQLRDVVVAVAELYLDMQRYAEGIDLLIGLRAHLPATDPTHPQLLRLLSQAILASHTSAGALAKAHDLLETALPMQALPGDEEFAVALVADVARLLNAQRVCEVCDGAVVIFIKIRDSKSSSAPLSRATWESWKCVGIVGAWESQAPKTRYHPIDLYNNINTNVKSLQTFDVNDIR